MNGCIAEVAEVDVAGRMVQTAAIESVDLDALRTTRWITGVGSLPNMSYATALPHLLGWRQPGPPPRAVTPHG